MGSQPVPDVGPGVPGVIDPDLPPYVMPEGEIPLEWAFSEPDADADAGDLLARALVLSPAEQRDVDPLRHPGTDRPPRTTPVSGTAFASSHVVRHLWSPFDEVVLAFASEWPRRRRRAALVRTGGAPWCVDADLRRTVPPGRLAVRLELRRWTAHHTTVDLHLQPDRAPHLPRLYFRAAHRALDDLLGALGGFRLRL